MLLAIHTGVPHDVWLDDPRAMSTALAILEAMSPRRPTIG